jgi:hypothetical protein
MSVHLTARALRTAALLPAALAVVSGLSILPARAATFYDVTLGLGLGDDARVFLNVTNDYFAPPPAVGMDLVRRCPDPVDDYPVILLLARASRRRPDEILRLRLDYYSWSDIMFRLRIPPSVLFVGLDRDPGPPYGRAWGYWRKHEHEERYGYRDRDIVELAKLQVAAGYHHQSPYPIAAERGRGVTVEQFVYEKNRGKYPGKKEQKGQPRGGGGKKPHGHPHDGD